MNCIQRIKLYTGALTICSMLSLVTTGAVIAQHWQPVRAQKTPEQVYIWSHNDYEQDLPLFKALSLGVQMIEADIHLIDNKLYVAHDHPSDLLNTPVLEEMYLTPLSNWIDDQGGVVHPDSDLDFFLVIDVKTDAEATYEAILDEIEPYRKLFFRLEDREWVDGPVKLLISGNRPQINPETNNRIAFIDGRIRDSGYGLDTRLYPIISDHWFTWFSWDGDGQMPEEERQRLHTLVAQVQQEGKLIRFWATPDKKTVWDELMKANIDIINVDDLKGMTNYLNSRAGEN
ncbi:MAG: hypothetical protein EA363_02240 [Balneolaceae bacterium]|nr:MAG: hypothetical protein EA363_02240 [Balneolaceae bacterium]